MQVPASRTRRGTLRFLLGSMAAFCLAVPIVSGRGEPPQDKTEAAKVARKLARAVGTAHDAEKEREALHDFREEVAEYAELHTKQVDKLGGREQSAAKHKELAQGIAAKRDKATRGDIFRPSVEPVFRRLIAEQLKGPDTLDARKAVIDGNPAHEEESVPVVLRVNAIYPVGAPRSTVPPSLLLTLPTLPESLHYRFVGRDLVLLDSLAQIIVDFLPVAAPDLAAK